MTVANPRLPEFDEDSPLRPSRFSHIVLRTKRFKEMAHWYKTVLHAEPLFEIPRGKPVEVEVSVMTEGASQEMKFNEAAVVQLLDTVTVSCLPRELPDRITVDVSELEINDSIYVKDLKTPAGEIMTDPEAQLLVVKAVSLFVEEEETVAEGEEGVEGEEGAEGEASEDDADDKSDD